MDCNADLALIARQEEQLRFASFDSDTAWDVGTALRLAARERRAAAIIDISMQALTLFNHAADGATPDNADWVRRKRNVTLRFCRSSYAVGLELKRDGRTLEDRFGLSSADYMAHGGSFPIRLAASPLCIGAITVSGLPQREDHDLVVRGLAQLLGRDPGEFALR